MTGDVSGDGFVDEAHIPAFTDVLLTGTTVFGELCALPAILRIGKMLHRMPHILTVVHQ